jgi:hypothetical protein
LHSSCCVLQSTGTVRVFENLLDLSYTLQNFKVNWATVASVSPTGWPPVALKFVKIALMVQILKWRDADSHIDSVMVS